MNRSAHRTAAAIMASVRGLPCGPPKQIAIDVAYGRWKGQGGDVVGAGQEVWNTAVSYPLTQDQVHGLADSDGKLYILATVVWTGDDRKRHDWPVCEWTTDLKSGSIYGAVWHFCSV